MPRRMTRDDKGRQKGAKKDQDEGGRGAAKSTSGCFAAKKQQSRSSGEQGLINHRRPRARARGRSQARLEFTTQAVVGRDVE